MIDIESALVFHSSTIKIVYDTLVKEKYIDAGRYGNADQLICAAKRGEVFIGGAKMIIRDELI